MAPVQPRFLPCRQAHNRPSKPLQLFRGWIYTIKSRGRLKGSVILLLLKREAYSSLQQPTEAYGAKTLVNNHGGRLRDADRGKRD